MVSKAAKARSTAAVYFLNLGSEAVAFSVCLFQLLSAFLAAGVFHILSSSAPESVALAALGAVAGGTLAVCALDDGPRTKEGRREDVDFCALSEEVDATEEAAVEDDAKLATAARPAWPGPATVRC